MAKEAAMAHEERSRLGRGLAALIGDVGDEAAVLERTAQPAPRADRIPQTQPAQSAPPFADAELDELAASIRERGIIQPILVRAVRGAIDQYEIVAGERRWRAAQRAGLHDVPVLLLEVSDREALELAIIENVQRTDLNALEEANGYQALADEFNYSQDEIAKIVGKSRPHVSNTLRLLKLSDAVKAYINSGQLTAGHARLLVGQPNAEEFAELIVKRGLNVRQVEEMARRDGKKQAKQVRAPRPHGSRSRHRCAGEAADRCARPHGAHPASRRWRRHPVDPLPQSRTARRHHAAAGSRADCRRRDSNRAATPDEPRGRRDGAGDGEIGKAG